MGKVVMEMMKRRGKGGVGGKRRRREGERGGRSKLQ